MLSFELSDLSRDTDVGFCSLLCRLTGKGEEPIMGSECKESKERSLIALLNSLNFRHPPNRGSSASHVTHRQRGEEYGSPYIYDIRDVLIGNNLWKQCRDHGDMITMCQFGSFDASNHDHGCSEFWVESLSQVLQSTLSSLCRLEVSWAPGRRLGSACEAR